MSTLAATYLKNRDTADTLPVLSAIRGAVKAWAYIDGVSVPAKLIAASTFGCSTFSDNGVGNYSVYYTTPLSAQGVVGQAADVGIAQLIESTPTYVRLSLILSTTGAVRDGYPSFIVAGNLA